MCVCVCVWVGVLKCRVCTRDGLGATVHSWACARAGGCERTFNTQSVSAVTVYDRL